MTDWNAVPPPEDTSPGKVNWDAVPPPDAPPSAATTAYGAGDIKPDAAIDAIDLSRKTGLGPSFISANLKEVTAQYEHQQFVSQLAQQPAVKAWADQSPEHAAAVKGDMGPLGRIATWLGGAVLSNPLVDATVTTAGAALQGILDIGGAEAMRERMSVGWGSGGPFAGQAFDMEAATQEYDAQTHTVGENIARASPQMALYGAAGLLAGSAGTAALMYVQNKGVLARQIQQAQPPPPAAEWMAPLRAGQSVVPEDKALTEEQIDNYATAGSAAAAVTLAGLLGPTLRTVPGAREALKNVASLTLARASATTVGRAGILALMAYGGHTFLGALGMALQGTINAGTVQKAVGKDLDYGELARGTGARFMDALPVAATFAGYGPYRDYLEDRGRIMGAEGDATKLADMVKAAKESVLRQKSPGLASELFGALGRGAQVYIDYKAAKKVQDKLPDSALAEAELTQDSVAVPVGDYLAHLADDHETLKDDVKLDANGFTPREAQAVRDAIPPEHRDAVFGPMNLEKLNKVAERGGSEPVPDAQIKATLANLKSLGLAVPELTDAPRGTAPDEVVKEIPLAQLNDVKAEPFSEERLARARERQAAGTTEPIKITINEHGEKVLEDGGHRLTAAREAGAQNIKVAIRDFSTPPLHEVMVGEYGGTPEEWKKLLPPPAPGAPPPDYAAVVERTLRSKTLGEIQPGRYALAAERASDALTQQAQKSGDLAATRGQERNAVVSRAKEVELTSARDAARAMADKATELRTKYDAALKKLSGKGSEVFEKADAAIAQGQLLEEQQPGPGGLPSVSRGLTGFSAVFHGLLESIGAKESTGADGLAALPAVLERMQQSNTGVVFDPGALAGLLARPRDWSKLTPAEADHVIVAEKNLRQAAKNETVIGHENIDDAAAAIRFEAQALPKKTELLVPGNAPWWQRATKFPAAFNARALERLKIIGSMGETMKRLVVDSYYAAAEKEDQLSRTVGQKYTDAVTSLPKEMRNARFDPVAMPPELAAAYQRRGFTPNADRKFLWMTGLMWGDGQARERYVKGLGVSEDMVSNWLTDNISKPEWGFIEKVGGLHEGQLWDDLKSKEERKTGVAPEKSTPAPIFDRDGNKVSDGWYFPLLRDRRAYGSDGGVQSSEGPKSPMDLFGPNYSRPAVSHQFVKERAAQAAYVVDLNWDRIPQHIGQVIHDIAFDELVTNSAKLMMHPEVDAAMKERLGKEKQGQAMAWLYVAANERAEAAKNLGAIGSVFGFLRNRTQSSALGNSLPVLAAMATHSLVSLAHGEVGLGGAVDYVKALSPDVRQFATENSEALRQRQTSGKRGLQEDMSMLGDRIADSTLGKGLGIAARVAQFGQDFMDHTLGVGQFMAKYNEVLSGGGTHEEAAAAGNAMVRDNLQPREPAEKSMIMNDKGALSALLIFHGFFNKVYNKASDFISPAANAWATRAPFPSSSAPNDAFTALQRQNAQTDLTGAAWKTAEASGKFLALLGVLGLGKLALGHGREPDETWGQWAIRTMAGAAADLVPLLSNVTQPLIDKAVSGKARPVDFRAAPALAGVQKFVRSVQDAANDNKTDQSWKAVNAGVMAAGAGSSQYVNTLKYVTGPKGESDAAHGRVGSYIHGAMYGGDNDSETFPLAVQHLIGDK